MARLQRVQMISSEANSDDIEAIYSTFVARVNEGETLTRSALVVKREFTMLTALRLLCCCPATVVGVRPPV
jgi:hypothetical protein